MLGNMTPFELVDNVYFVGTYEASSHVIDTGDGLIMIDTGYKETADVILESMATLGLDIKNLRYILHSHGHADHTDGTPKILSLVNAETFLGAGDEKYINGWQPDHFYQDGQTICLGNTKILCIATPGHTEGTFSFFFDVNVNGSVYRAGMFGGAGTNQIKKDFLVKRKCSWLNRGLYLDSVNRLKKERVDIFLGNHSWNNKTRENYQIMQTSKTNPFIDSTKWLPFLNRCEANAWKVIRADSRERFVNYAHRGASEYAPENTFVSFYLGLYMNANGIETDVRMTKDGALVLFHDRTLERLFGEEGSLSDYTLEELRQFTLEKNGLEDKIVLFSDFLEHFSFRKIHFAIEIKQEGIEKQIADLLRRYQVLDRTIVTSFRPEYLRAIKEYDPEIRVGLLTSAINEETIQFLLGIGAEEICPRADEITPEKVEEWHRLGLNVRAWGVKDEALMMQVYDALADGMTVNFPDRLSQYIQENRQISE